MIEEMPALGVIRQETVDGWAPDEPPVTILFGDIGGGIAASFDPKVPETHRRVFQLIEDAMVSGNSELKTAVATGLIESLVTIACKSEGKWEQLLPFLGDASRRYVDAWTNS